MCACSPFFRIVFSGRWDSNAEEFYDVSDVSPHIMSCIVQYACTESVHICQENVAELLVAADRFLILKLVDACCDYLESQLSPENCICIFTSVKSFHSCSKLCSKARFFILNHFEEVLRISEEFLELSADDFVEFIGRDELNVKQEEMVFEAILRWVDRAPEERKTYTPVLLTKVRMGLMALDYFTKKVKNNRMLMENQSCASVIFNAAKVLFGNRTLGASDLVLMKELTRPRLPPAILLAIGGWSNTGPTSRIESYNVRAHRWVDVTQVDDEARAYHGTVALDGFVYYIGGFDSLNYFRSVRKFNPITQTWHEVAPMHEGRCYVSVALLDGQIYAIGGHDGINRLNTAERYDPQTNKWTRIATMNQFRSDASATTLHGKVYICGGFSGNECLFTAESYDPQMNQWTVIAPMMNPRSGVSVIAYGDLVYAVGGFNGENRLQSVEAYNPRTDRWHDVEPMIYQRSNSGIEVLDDRMFVVGGFNGSNTCNNVECYDHKTSLWSKMSDMSIHRSGLSLCVLSGFPEVAKYSANQD
ncbi:kelch-like protein 10 isoform X2 [Triplophysa dalaica]|nr:kelch-like protein 10 isoform X2 [Triplophysa dalaica]